MADTRSLSFRGRLLRSILIGILLIAGMVVAGIKVAQLYLRSAEKSYAGKMPIYFGDYVPADLPAGAINATDYLEAATLLVDGQSWPGEVGPSVGRPSTDQGLTQIAERLRLLETQAAQPPLAADLELFHDAVRRLDLALAVYDRGVERATHSRALVDYGVVPMSIRIPNLMAYLRLGHLVRARAVVAASEGRAADAWRDAASLYRTSDWIRQSMPTLIHTLVARSLANQGAWLVQHLLSTAPADAATRAAVLTEARRVDPQRLFERIHGAERSAVFSTLVDRRTPHTRTGLPTWGPWLDLNAGAYLRWAGPAFERCDKPYRELRQQPATVKDELPSWAPVAKMMVFDCAISSSPKRDLWKVAIDQLTIALELEKARERTGAYPEGLMAADADIPQLRDPFSGEPYLYRREGAGYLLYSVGMNGKDDGGASGRNDQGTADPSQGDVVWRVQPLVAPAPVAPVAEPASGTAI